MLYGLHLARPSIAKQDRAIVVEGNTDVIALRQAGVEPVVASMGTALTESQLRELGRLTKRLVPVLRLRRGRAGGNAPRDGARREAGVRRPCRRLAEGRGSGGRSRFVRRPARDRRELRPLSRPHRAGASRRTDRRRSSARGRSSPRVEDSPERQEALRLLADRLDLPRETLAGLAPASAKGVESVGPRPAPRVLEAGRQRERDLLAAVVRNPSLVPELAALTPDHFDDELHRRFRDLLVGGGSEDEELVTLRAELGARADRDAIDERTGKELLLRVHERRLRRELQGADLVRATELQARLAKVHSALAELV